MSGFGGSFSYPLQYSFCPHCGVRLSTGGDYGGGCGGGPKHGPAELPITIESRKGVFCFVEEDRIRIDRLIAALEETNGQADCVGLLACRTCLTCEHEPEWHPGSPLAARDVGICGNKSFRDSRDPELAILIDLCKTGDTCTHAGFVISNCPAWSPKATVADSCMAENTIVVENTVHLEIEQEARDDINRLVDKLDRVASLLERATDQFNDLAASRTGE